MQLEEINIQSSRLCHRGLWNGISEGTPVIALHGWLDNAASFAPLAEHLQLNQPFYAIEMAGHGKSEHRPQSASYALMENVVDLAALINTLAGEQGKVVLLGHSLGAIICSLYAASSPERVERLVMLDSLGPITDETEAVLPQLRRAMARATRVQGSKLAIYPSLEKAAQVRSKGVGRLDISAARLLVERGIQSCEGGYMWRSDPRLLEPTFVRFSEAQVQAIYRGINCPVCLICGKDGYFSERAAFAKRLAYIDQIETYHVAGGHHFHMDGDVVAANNIIQEFVTGESTNPS